MNDKGKYGFALLDLAEENRKRDFAGCYQIIEELGRGGMGVVYKAEDRKLARKVVIEVLRGIFTSDPERLARFEREVRILASLIHPNIAATYGIKKLTAGVFLSWSLSAARL
jgi:serine/threonine protein kinase